MFALLVVTLGVYGAVWLRRQVPAFNARLPKHPISARFIVTALLFSVADLSLFILSFFWPEGTFMGIEGTVSAFATGILLVGALRIRRRIQFLATVDGGPPPAVSLLGTILLNVAYLQAKINRHIDALAESHQEIRDRPFRDSRRIAWVVGLGLPALAAAVVLVIVIVPRGAELVATASFERARAGALARLGPLSEERFAATEPELHPLVLASEALELEATEKERLEVLAAGSVLRPLPEDAALFLAPILARNHAPLEQIARWSERPARRLGLTYPLIEEWSFPLFPNRSILAVRLLFVQGRLALDDGRLHDVEAILRQLSTLARVYEEEPHVVPQLIGIGIERQQLRLVRAVLERCPDEQTASEIAGSLLDRPMEDRLVDSLAYSAALYIAYEKRSSGSPTDDDREETALLLRGLPEVSSRAVVRYSLAGALDSLPLNADLYHAEYTAMRAGLEIDPDELGFFEQMQKIAGPNDWRLPAKFRSLSDAREGAGFALRTHAAAPRPCDVEAQRLGPLAAIYTVSGTDAGDCRLHYRLAEDFASAREGDEIPPPPFTWRLGCGGSSAQPERAAGAPRAQSPAR